MPEDTHKPGESDLDALLRWKARCEEMETRKDSLKDALEEAYFGITEERGSLTEAQKAIQDALLAEAKAIQADQAQETTETKAGDTDASDAGNE
jgi:hypothetical protein